ncbi:MAG TPA: hypothetical protein VIX14_04720 [Terriglobales bacterium]
MAQNRITIIDNRTEHTDTLPIEDGTIRAMTYGRSKADLRTLVS